MVPESAQSAGAVTVHLWVIGGGPGVAACAVVARTSKSAQHLHFRTKQKRRFPLRALLVVLVVLVILAGTVAIRAATEATPSLTAKRVLPASVVLSGLAPNLAWPASGSAAAEVEGLPPLGWSGPTSPRPIASLAKIMTAFVVLQDHPIQPGQPGFTVTISAADVADYRSRVAQQQSVVAVSPGETLNELQLLQALLVGSGNNIAALLAGYGGGSSATFVAKMNATAQRLDMTHTTYTDPSGLAPTTVSTASDQLLLAAQAMAVPVFASIVAMPSVNLPVAGTVANFNRAVGTGGFVGIKTGSDATAGGCLVFANTQKVGDHTITILGAVLGQGQGQTQTAALTAAAFTAATNLVHSVTASVAVRTVVPAGTVVAVVSNTAGAKVNVATTQPLTTLGFDGLTVPLSMTLSALGHHLSAGQVVGSVALASVPDERTSATATSATSGPTWRWRLSHVL
jgi:D-alanyl-D-alanine carboxypeptidase (penicillin-binding protein 5/6)